MKGTPKKKKMKNNSLLPPLTSWLCWQQKVLWLKTYHTWQQQMATSLFCPNDPWIIPTGTLTLSINRPSPYQRGERSWPPASGLQMCCAVPGQPACSVSPAAHLAHKPHLSPIDKIQSVVLLHQTFPSLKTLAVLQRQMLHSTGVSCGHPHYIQMLKRAKKFCINNLVQCAEMLLYFCMTSSLPSGLPAYADVRWKIKGRERDSSQLH